MRKLLLPICILAASTFVANAQLIKADLLSGYTIGQNLERYEYTASTGVPAQAFTWCASGNVTNKPAGSVSPIVEAGDTYANYVNTTGLAIPIGIPVENNNRVSVYSLTDGTEYNGIYYLAFLLNSTNAGTSANDFIAFDGNFTGNTARGKVFVGKTAEGKMKLSIAVDGDRTKVGTVAQDLEFSQTHLVILKIDLPSKTASIIVNPTIDKQNLVEPAMDASYTNAAASSMGSIKGIQIKQRSTNPGKVSNLRLAATWKEVLGLVNVPISAAAANITENSATANWTVTPDPNVTNFRVDVYLARTRATAATLVTSVTTPDANATSASIVGLSPSTNYTYTVTAIGATDYMESAPSSVTAFVTSEPVSINDSIVDNAQTVSSKYYDLSGAEVNTPEEGKVYIKKVVLDNGKVISTKAIK